MWPKPCIKGPFKMPPCQYVAQAKSTYYNSDQKFRTLFPQEEMLILLGIYIYEQVHKTCAYLELAP